ncbi:phage tail protein [Aquimarina aggregata]|uniref:Phage tail protein n=1 Tax=Aquimarina aggregata TaxID=1642818 RepID=A0A162ZFD1_9FLAO|nr:phage tail sheath C-terminal domain-containing protein [Aquimarina aggregata]KZS39763.1 phage tail protein [Aquimarina aggregata]
MAQKLMTPGVYIEEINAFPGSVVEVATAIPAFIGYTEIASRNGKSLINQPVRITSFKEFYELFGGGFNPKFTLNKVGGNQAAAPKKPEKGKGADDKAAKDPKAADSKAATTDHKHLVTINGEERAIEYKDNNLLFMYNSIKLFYANGGGTCYIVSVGTFSGKDAMEIKKDDILGEATEGGLMTLLKQQEPTMIVIPDAVALGDDCYEVYKQVLAHCAKMQSRVAILDIYDGDGDRIVGDASVDVVTKFREKIGTENLNYASAYYPWLNTNIVESGEITFKNLDESVVLNDLLPEEKAKALLAANASAAKETSEALIKNNERNLHLGLMATSPTYTNLLDEIREVMNLLPPSAAMAGIYTTVDNNRGVWKSPANISFNSVIKPSANITHDQQENLNVDAISGKSINAIRTFPGVGTLVWGGRTLDGNSLDWRYINVRRTMIMLEQSIKLALRAYVFEPNDANTWVTVKSMIINFLTEKWKQGALAGASPDDAFDVQIGLGSTMTSLDILEGKMLVTIKLAIVRPAEFIVVTFQQQMQKS